MPLGNLTSQFFANIFLNELDQFVKHNLKAKHYIRYVDDFVILHNSQETLESFKENIQNFLKNIKLDLHPDKSKIILLDKGITFLGYRVFCHHRLLKKSNLRKFRKNLAEEIEAVGNGEFPYGALLDNLHGWLEYSRWANTYKLRKGILNRLDETFQANITDKDIDRWIRALKIKTFRQPSHLQP